MSESGHIVAPPSDVQDPVQPVHEGEEEPIEADVRPGPACPSFLLSYLSRCLLQPELPLTSSIKPDPDPDLAIDLLR